MNDLKMTSLGRIKGEMSEKDSNDRLSKLS
jgi:hypothetical protein